MARSRRVIGVWWVVGLAIGFLACGQTAQARDDWNLWHDETVRVWARDRYALNFYQAARYRDDMSEPFFVQFKIVNRYALHPMLAIAGNYSYIQQKGSDNHWRDEHRPELELVPTFTIGPVALEQRLRMELRLIEGDAGEENWRCRYRMQAVLPIPRTDGKLRLFANEEIFYATPPDEWNQNRVFVGLSLAVHSRVATSVSWGIQSLRRGSDWEDRQILFVSAKVTL